MLGSPVPKAQDEREDLVGQRRRSGGAPGASAGLAGVRDRGRAEAAHERRRRRRAAGEAQVAQREELHDGLAQVALPGSGVGHGREQVDGFLPVAGELWQPARFASTLYLFSALRTLERS